MVFGVHMKKSMFFIIFSVLISSCASKNVPEPRVCGELPYFGSKKDIYRSFSISLLPKPSVPNFYLYVGSSEPYHQYAVMVSPESLVRELDRQIKEGIISHWGEVLLGNVKRDLPLRENTDISKYGFISYALISGNLSIFTNLISKGQASLVDFWNIRQDGSPGEINVVTVAHIANRGAESREVCTPAGEKIFSLVDVWY
jgi:hypothetical protein